jgi:DsbC/DsbD-like thiol-disulfide interchange protein
MKKLFFALCLFALPVLAMAQEAVTWDFSTKKISETEYEVIAKATIGKGWHLYAQDAGEGPIPTSFTFTKNPLVTPNGKVAEVGKLLKEFDKNFNSELKYYENTVSFVQKVQVKGKATTKFKGMVTYMVCNDHECLPPNDVEFTVTIGGK